MNRTVITILFFLILASSCRKDNSVPAFTSSSYPLSVGNWWQYQLMDLYYGSIDTITLRVISMTKMDSYTRYGCNFIYNGNVTDSVYFLQSDTSMSFVVSNSYSVASLNFHLKFPVEAGQKWPGAFPGDTTVVNTVAGSEKFYGHTYGPCYSTTESYNLPHNFKAASMTLTPKIGLIQQAITFNSDTAGKTATYSGGIQIQQQINLINYHVQ